MQRMQRRVLISVTLVLLTALWGRSAGAQTTERVSVASGGTEGNGASLGSALSADGRFVAFDSAATDLVAGDTNGVSDVFAHDRQTGTTERVSVASGGAQGNGSSGLIGFAFPPALSADGRFIAFVSFATNLVAGDTNGATDVFVHDRLTGTTERVSVASGGTQSNAGSLGSALSADGRFVAFQSDGTNLVPGDTNGATDVFVHDRVTGATERVSVASGGGTQGNRNSGGFFAFPALSADGRLVAFESDATNLVATDTNGATDVFVHDRLTGTTERVSVASGGSQGNGFSAGPVLSGDGRFVAFVSFATNLVAGDTNGATDVFVHDRQTGTTERVSVASGGTQGNDSSAGPVLSADGGLVAFHSTATNLVAGDANGAYDVFVRDRAVSTTTSSTTQPATTSTSSTTTSVSVTSTTSTSTTTSSSTTRPPTTTSTTTQPTTTTRPTTTTSTTTTSTTTTTKPTTTTTTQPTTTTTTRPTTTTSTTTTSTTTTTSPTTTTSTTTQPTTTTTRPTTTTLACEPAQLAEDSLAGVECAIGAVRATLNSPPQPACECKHCSLEPVLERIAGFVMQADGATRPKKCKRNLSKAGRAAKALRARVASVTRRNCLAPADRVARLDSEVVDLSRRTRALFKSRFCVSR